MKKIEELYNNSGLPGPRANLTLLYKFAYDCSNEEIAECFKYDNEDISNSPEEFVLMCGIVAYCVSKTREIKMAASHLRKYASHKSWRVREALAIGFQEIAVVNMEEVVEELIRWLDGNAYEQRAVVATLCEPKLLKEYNNMPKILHILVELILSYNKISEKLTEAQGTLKKALAYGLSVAIVHAPEEGKIIFEKLSLEENKHIHWILKNNLKKKRLSKMDEEWVKAMSVKLEAN